MSALSEKLFNKIQSDKVSPNLSRDQVQQFSKDIFDLLNPQGCERHFATSEDLKLFADETMLHLIKILNSIMPTIVTTKIIDDFHHNLSSISDRLDLDAKAFLEGDPAAYSLEEVILCYPGFFAITLHRIANFFYKAGVPIFPRMISEYAHRETGIDIHPGATIGDSFFIDHGTGVVIGETTHIGNNVKIYQGVTLGALSVKKSLAGKKRHPTVEDGSVIYSGATILGGETIIGQNSIIGGNVWLTESVPAYSIVYNKSKMKLLSQVKNKK